MAGIMTMAARAAARRQRGLVESVAAMTAAARYATWGYDVPLAPRDAILGITEAFLEDNDPHKINLGVGAYRDSSGLPVVLQCVREAEHRIGGQNLMEYLPMEGSKTFVDLSIKLAYGEDCDAIKDDRIAAVQTLSGTGACRLMAEYLAQQMPERATFIPAETWANHYNIWRSSHAPFSSYRYYCPSSLGLDFYGLLSDVRSAPPESVFLFHACAHNPTGVDPTPEQWKSIAEECKQKKHRVVFDMAYQGFASGDLSHDAFAVRHFVSSGVSVALAQSYAKNMGLYGQRVGCLSVVCESEDEKRVVESQLKKIARPMYSNPPLHGALLVSTILSDAPLSSLWHSELRGMADRIKGMRTELRTRLEESESQSGANREKWTHITDQIGMFCYTGMTKEQVHRLTSDFHVYLTSDGRISIAGITPDNVDYLANAIHRVTTSA